MVLTRLGQTCASGACPAIYVDDEQSGEDVIVQGVLVAESAYPDLELAAVEALVTIPRSVLLAAAKDLEGVPES